MESEHTPGPWHAEFVQQWPFGVKVMAPSGVVMEQAGACHSTVQKTRQDCENGLGFNQKSIGFTTRDEAIKAIGEQDANARLIAAAPELLEACAAALREFRILAAGHAVITVGTIERAIAKAEGRQ